jgi:GxxExxY protein
MSSFFSTAENAETTKNVNELMRSDLDCWNRLTRFCLCRELSIRGIPFERQVPIPAGYKGVKLACGYRADIVVDGRVLVKIKALDSLLPIHEAQLLTYLKLGGWKIGLLINFNVELLGHGLRRRVLGLEEVTL